MLRWSGLDPLERFAMNICAKPRPKRPEILYGDPLCEDFVLVGVDEGYGPGWHTFLVWGEEAAPVDRRSVEAACGSLGYETVSLGSGQSSRSSCVFCVETPRDVAAPRDFLRWLQRVREARDVLRGAARVRHRRGAADHLGALQ